jgi:uncharacterized protein (DUF427 family)
VRTTEDEVARAIWNDVVIAESDTYEQVEGNIYFPPQAVEQEYLTDSDYQTTCPWKGQASYYNVVANGKVSENAAWFYPDPKPAASHIKDHVAFWKGVRVER